MRRVQPVAGTQPGSCVHCMLKAMCLPDSLSESDVKALEDIIIHPAPVDKDGHLFRMGEPLENIYVIRAGTLKSYQLSEDGEEQVTGFALPGELVGLDGMADGQHPTAAVALERTTVCAIPMTAFEQVAGRVSGLNHRFTRMVGKYIVAEQDLLLIRARDTAEERMALFLLNFSERLRARGYAADAISLCMPRRDIGKYLGLAVETISRTLTRFRGLGLIEVDRRQIRLLDLDGLREIGRR